MAEEARREGAPGGEAGADSRLDPDTLNAVQLAILAAVRADESPDSAPTSNEPDAEVPVPGNDAGVREAVATFLHGNVPALDVPPLAPHPKAQAGRVHRARARRVAVRGRAPRLRGHRLRLPGGYRAGLHPGRVHGRPAPAHRKAGGAGVPREDPVRDNRIGVNINQMVYVLHRDDRIEPDIRERLERLDRMLTHIARALLLPTDDTTGGTTAWSFR